MRKILALAASVTLCGCIQVYGPVKTGPSDTNTSQSADSASSSVSSNIKIGNRKPEETFSAALAFMQQRGLKVDVQDSKTGILAATGNDESLSSTLLDCSALEQTQNIQEQYRVVAQIWSAGVGTNVSVQVTGTAGLTTPDGNDKVKPVECQSTGMLEKDMLEALRK
ncbi:hypothetical protein [Pantoea septica]|uniref:hypothetical protein n=1 Tax=Pantoea septica TaxID=472695 RepID=UPI00053519EC|nr:hypothetical protein [Pantoea septica]